jgi:four helix bundle protein
MSSNIIIDKSFKFSLNIISLYKKLVAENEYVISKQILKSGTSIGANVEEAQGGQSKKDFISKISIAYKEARETKYWLRLLKEGGLSKINVDDLLIEITEINKILASIIKSSKT